MPLLASESSSAPRQLPPAGTHIARCYSVIDLGTQKGEYMGKPKLTHKIRLSWELPDELAVFNEEKGEQPFSIHREYTLSLGEKANLRHDLEGWRGKAFTADELKGFDIFNLIGVPCLLTVIHKQADNGNTYANVTGIAKLAKGMACPPAVNDTVKYEVASGRNTTFMTLPEWLQKKIAESVEFNAEPEQTTPERAEKEDDDSIPF